MKTPTFSVFGTRAENKITMPNAPYPVAYPVELNYKKGGAYTGGDKPYNRKTNPQEKIPTSIIKVSKFVGDRGEGKSRLWTQIFHIPLEPPFPKNCVCVSYIAGQAIINLHNKVQEALDYGDPGFGIFTISFKRKGKAYEITFDWRERSKEEEQQLEQIEEFMQERSHDLIDLTEGYKMTCVDNWDTEEIAALLEEEEAEAERTKEENNQNKQA